MKNEQADFSLFTGDFMYKGGEKIYWEEPGDYFPEGVREKIFPIPGNHETWEDSLLTNYFSFFDHLGDNHSYYFKRGNSLFISLCTGGDVGKYSPSSAFKQDQEFTCIKATYKELQLPEFLKEHSAEMAASGDTLKNVFVQYHKPSFSYYKHPPLNEANDPVEALKAFGNENTSVKMFVFNGHNHTTEMYKPTDNITVLVAGGGGAPQKTITKGKLPSRDVLRIYKKKGVNEVFWTSLGMKSTDDRTQRVNYWIVSVNDETADVTITEKVLTVGSKTNSFVEGLSIINGKLNQNSAPQKKK
ncbi:MAG: hypothetical protein GY795_05000 [Desulfobacterales bacterium]|nr:hypothetical protein [Desulfobacterales bacterium]